MVVVVVIVVVAAVVVVVGVVVVVIVAVDPGVCLLWHLGIITIQFGWHR